MTPAPARLSDTLPSRDRHPEPAQPWLWRVSCVASGPCSTACAMSPPRRGPVAFQSCPAGGFRSQNRCERRRPNPHARGRSRQNRCLSASRRARSSSASARVSRRCAISMSCARPSLIDIHAACSRASVASCRYSAALLVTGSACSRRRDGDPGRASGQSRREHSPAMRAAPAADLARSYTTEPP